MIVLGISAFYHDSAAAIVRDGEVIAAAQEERFTRKKNDADFPVNACNYCLQEAGISLDEIDYVGFYDKPLLTFDRLLETYLTYTPRGFTSFAKAIPIWVKEKLLQKNLIINGVNDLGEGEITEDNILFGYHHHSHAAAAFYPSPFDNAAVVVMDGVGEWATTTIGIGDKKSLRLEREIRFPHSLGMLYSAFTYYLGFKVNDGEYKVMGLAPYGEPKFAGIIRDKLLDMKDDGSFRLDMSYFNFATGLTMTNQRFADLFGAPVRSPADPLTRFHMDVARSVQAVAEDLILNICREAHRLTNEKNLCLSGGVALNCVANGRVLREGPFENVWIQPASGDAGSALGVALAIENTYGDKPYVAKNGSTAANDAKDAMKGSYLGPEFTETDVETILNDRGAIFEKLSDADLYETVAQALADDAVVGWFQGRMEFGPRALGNRSILGNPASKSMQKTLNLKIKYRESFRPFAPAVMQEDVGKHFDLSEQSPYMLIVAPVSEHHKVTPSKEDQNATGLDRLDVVRSQLPAITHVDFSARVQTVSPDVNERFYSLLGAFKKETGTGILVNTSFNVRDEPIVCSPDDAYRCFMATEMDILVIGNIVLWKDNQ